MNYELTITHAAAVTKVKRGTLQSAVRYGHVPARKVRGIHIIDLRDVLRWNSRRGIHPAVALARQGYKVPGIAHELGMKEPAVARALQRAGISTRRD